MDEKIRIRNRELTQLYKWEDDLYSRYSIYCGLSDPAMWVLYTLYEATLDPGNEKQYTQNELVSTWYYPKQTINYAVMGLSKKGFVTLEQRPGSGNSKTILLTPEGTKFCTDKILPLMQAEEHSFSRMTEEEQELLLQLSRKKCAYLDEEIRQITGDTTTTKL